MKKPTTTASRKLKAADKKKALTSFAELAESIITLADRQDKYDDNVQRITNAQERLQASMDNFIAATKSSQELAGDCYKYARELHTEPNEKIFSIFAEIKSINSRINTVNASQQKTADIVNQINDDHSVFSKISNMDKATTELEKIVALDRKELQSQIEEIKKNSLPAKTILAQQKYVNEKIEAYNNKPWYKRIFSKI